MKVLVKVTPEVLERSKMCGNLKTKNCAIAVAIRDLFPEAWIELSYCNLLGEGILQNCFYAIKGNDTAILPLIARNFIDQFDSKDAKERVLMTPFSFEIEVPEYVIEKIGIGQVMKVLSESKTLEHCN